MVPDARDARGRLDDRCASPSRSLAPPLPRERPTDSLPLSLCAQIGGCDWGGYVNDEGQNNPTYEFYPSRGGPVGLNILTTTLPANLFPLIWLLPSGNIFLQANWGTEIFDYKNNVEYPLADIPHAVRTYPGSAATAMMPLTPANNWTATIMFCGGTNLQPDQWTLNWNVSPCPLLLLLLVVAVVALVPVEPRC